MSEMLSAALWYATQGFPVFPCKPRGKEPLTKHGFKDATIDATQIKTWWGRWPEANIGIPTGEISGLLVVDIDPRHGGNDSLDELTKKHGAFPATAEQLTGGGGRHIVLHYSGGSVPAKLAPGIDLKGDGGYVVVAPSVHPSGELYRWDGIAGERALLSLSDAPAWLLEHIDTAHNRIARAKMPTDAAAGEKWGPGERNNRLASLAGTMRRRGMTQHAIESALLEENRLRCDPPLPEEEVRRIAESVASYPAAGEDLASLPLTDSGNAERFQRLYRDKFRFSAPERSWYVWTGRRWAPDKTGSAMAETKHVARGLYREAADIEDKERRETVAHWARKSESCERRRAMLALAQTEGDFPITPDQWDPEPWLFNCASGTIDLRTGDLRPHDKGDRITKLASVEYEPWARSLVWEGFLRDVTGDDPEYMDFLMRAAGYSLTGDTREEVLFMPLGPGGTGKSTFLEAIRGVMGDYARTADFETFVQKRGEGPRNDIAALAGRRMVISIEVEQGKRIAEGIVKSITGRDTISARFLYQEAFEFRPQFKLWLAANDAPQVRHADDAIWRRILRLPFNQVVPIGSRDPTLKTRLCSEPEYQRAILAWLVEGTLRWKEDGLRVPVRISQATQAYREEQNPLLDFLADSCERGKDLSVSAGDLRKAYDAWCEPNGQKPISAQQFAASLRTEGFEQIRPKRAEGSEQRPKSSRVWRGIGLKS